MESARSELMSRVRQKDTAPEMVVRRLLHGLGYRYRVHRRDLPGTPDVVFPRWKKVVFIHGCFWHRHPLCRYASTPKTHCDFWLKKFQANQARDQKILDELADLGWDVFVVWSCETKDIPILTLRLKTFLA